MIWMSGPDNACIFVSRRWLEFTGARLEDQLADGWVRLVHPEDRDALLRVFETAFPEKREFSHEYRLRHKDGDYRWVPAILRFPLRPAPSCACWFRW